MLSNIPVFGRGSDGEFESIDIAAMFDLIVTYTTHKHNANKSIVVSYRLATTKLHASSTLHKG